MHIPFYKNEGYGYPQPSPVFAFLNSAIDGPHKNVANGSDGSLYKTLLRSVERDSIGA